MASKKPLVCAYYFPNWHPNPQNTKWHGTGWTEWEVLKCARPRFPGHKQPKIPLWGYEDESNPAVMNKKIRAASDYGIDAFIFDWYWYEEGGPYRNRCLEEGFLQASNCRDLQFSIMWCNHDAKQSHPGSRMFCRPTLCNGDVSPETFLKATDHCIKHYFPHPNYMRINGDLYFSIYRLPDMVETLGGIKAAAECFKNFRKRVKDAKLGELHLNAISIGNSESFLAKTDSDAFKGDINELLAELGINSQSGHAWNWVGESFPFTDYWSFALRNLNAYETYTSRLKIPYNPAVYARWDSSPRSVQSEIYEDVGYYPFRPILSNDTPGNFEEVLRRAKDFLLSDKSTGSMLLIHSWNEWTEGAYIEPDTEYGYAYLEAIKHVFGA